MNRVGVMPGAVFAMQAGLLSRLRRRFAIDVFEVTRKVARVVQADSRHDLLGAHVGGGQQVSCRLHAQRLQDLGRGHAQLLVEQMTQP